MFEYKVLKADVGNLSIDKKFAQAVLNGLSLEQKRLPSWLIFDNRGSEIFKEIIESPEYLPAACEFEIINTHKKLIADLISKEPFQLADLGSGDGSKTQILIKNILNRQTDFHYYPIDISEGAIRNLVKTFQSRFKNTTLQVTGLVADYLDGLKKITSQTNYRNLVLFLGVTLNNMDPLDSQNFLRKLHEILNDNDYLLIGFDLMKSPKLLYDAYNDSKGLFEKFNLHLLDRINEMLNGNFNKELFLQQGHYNPKSHAFESYLYSKRSQIVHIKELGKKFKFEAWEGMKTEQSYKYNIEEIRTLAGQSGFEVIKYLYDSKKYFVDAIWKVKTLGSLGFTLV